MNIHYFEALASTNTYLKNNHDSYQNFDVIIAKHQTKGRGRLDHSWFSSEDSLTCSILVKDIDEQAKSLMPYYMAYVIHHVLYDHKDHLTIKWPNDILLNHKKICGILVESIYQGPLRALVVGFGLNINNTYFPEDIKTIASSLKLQRQKDYEIDKISLSILNYFEDHFDMLKNQSQTIIDYCNQYLAFKGLTKSFLTQKGKQLGQIKKIDDQGHLLIQTNDGDQRLITGEISWDD